MTARTRSISRTPEAGAEAKAGPAITAAGTARRGNLIGHYQFSLSAIEIVRPG